MYLLLHISKLLQHAKRIRLIGTAATDLAYVADALVNHAADAWYIEAGKLLVIEAGEKATMQQRNTNGVFIYSSGVIHTEVDNLLFSKSNRKLVIRITLQINDCLHSNGKIPILSLLCKQIAYIQV